MITIVRGGLLGGVQHKKTPVMRGIGAAFDPGTCTGPGTLMIAVMEAHHSMLILCTHEN